MAAGVSVGLAPARARRPGFQPERLLVIDPLTRRVGDYVISELPRLLVRGDVLVVNDAATLPASLRVDEELELRLVAERADGTFDAVTFGAGDRRMPTEQRGAPRPFIEGDCLSFDEGLAARVVHVDAQEPRLIRLRFELSGIALWSALYRRGAPIQYSHVDEPLALWDVQNRYASRPWAVEMPSAGRPLTFDALLALERRGATVSYVTHAASISSTGSPTLDARLPLPERYDVPRATVDALQRARRRGGRVIAAGTSVVRALEGHADADGELLPGSGEATLVLGPGSDLRLVEGLLTGLHEPGTSHFELLEAFAPRALLLRALTHAAKTGYLQHELGDSCLILAGALREGLAA
jgi:S-adenosylmethionine:tRNA ribosyltransferase-isomerase